MKHILSLAALLAVVPCIALAQTPQSVGAGSEAISVERIAEIEDPAALTQLIDFYRQGGDEAGELAALDRRIALRPHIGLYKLDKAVTLARDDKKGEAYALLIELQNTGYAYDLRDDPRFKNLNTTQVWKYIVDNFDANRSHFGQGKLVHTLPREDLLLESVAFDSTRKQLLAGSAREGKVYLVSDDGKLAPLAVADQENGMWAVFDLAIDPKRSFLWVASTAVPHFKGYDAERHYGRAGVFQFDLKAGAFIKSFLSPPASGGQPFVLSSITVGSDGEVYVADGVNRAIYQVRDDQFRRILHLPMLSSISSLAVAADGRKLYMADPERGIIGVELGTLRPFDVLVPEKLTLEGISSINTYGNALIAVQSGMNPPRVMRFDLNAEGNAIAKVTPLEASNPAFAKPGAATMDGSTMFLIANEQKDNYDRFGLLRNKDKLEGTRIVKINTTPAAEGSQPGSFK